MRDLTEFESHLVDLVQYLASTGLSLKEIKQFLNTRSRDHRNLTPLEHIQKHGGLFLNELKTFMNENDLG